MEKTLHLLRHAQGFHNVEGEILHQLASPWRIFFDGKWKRLSFRHIVRALRCIWCLILTWIPSEIIPANSQNQKTLIATGAVPSYYEHQDATLTALGWQQVKDLRTQLNAIELRNQLELVVVSPLTRALQTASGVFEREDSENQDSLLMMDNVGRFPHPAIFSPISPSFVAVESCREHISFMPCDQRSSISKCKLQFPGVDFSNIKDEEDKLWRRDAMEAEEDLDKRTRDFLDWISSRPEEEIAVVSHGGFLSNLLHKFGDETVNKMFFVNCELRSFKLRKVLGEDFQYQLSSV